MSTYVRDDKAFKKSLAHRRDELLDPADLLYNARLHIQSDLDAVELLFTLEAVLRTQARPRTLKMQRLASEVKKSLTPLQAGSLAAALLRAGVGLPAVIARNESVLSISQRNAVLALAVCNDIHALASFFEEEAGTGNGVWNDVWSEKL
jgi:hypothetical protein